MKTKSMLFAIVLLIMSPLRTMAVDTVEIEKEQKTPGNKGKSSIVVVSTPKGLPENQVVGWNTYAEAPPYMEGFFGDYYHRSERHGFKAKLMVMYRLVDQLELDEDTATKFFPVYMTYINERDKMMKEHRDMIKSISDGVENEDVDISVLQKKIKNMWQMEKDIEAQRSGFLKKAEKILDDRQYIKLVVFNDKLKEDLISQFRSARIREESRRKFEEQRQKIMEDAGEIQGNIKENKRR